jgi:WD40 repeat protein
MRAGVGRVLGIALAIASCASPPAAAPATHAPDVAPSCREAAAMRARVPQLLAEGKLDRTVRVIHDADLLCPGSARETRVALLDTLRDLGRQDAAEQAARDILVTPGTADSDLEHARDALQSISHGRDGEQPWRSPLEAATSLFSRSRGGERTPEGQRLLDRGVALMERDGATMSLDVQWPGYGGAAWLPDGRLVVSLGGKQSRIVRVDTGEVMPLPVDAWLLAPSEPAQPPVVSPDGRFVIVDAGRGERGLYRSDTGKEVRLLDVQGRGAWWSPDGHWLAWARGNEVKLLALDGNDERDLQASLTKAEVVEAVALGDHAVVARTSEGRLRFWELPSRRDLGTAQALASGDESRRLEMSPDGSTVAAWVEGPTKKHPEVALFDTATGKRVATLRDPRCTPASFAMHPSKPELAMGGPGVICFWDTATRQLRRVMRPDLARALHDSLASIAGAGSASSASVAMPLPKQVRDIPLEAIHWEGPEPKIALSVVYMLGDTRFDDDGTPDLSPLDPRIVATPDGPMVKGSTNVLAHVRSRSFIGVAERWPGLVVSPDGRYVLELTEAGRVWDAQSGRVVRRLGEHDVEQRILWTTAGLTRVADPTRSAEKPTPSPNGKYTAVAREPHGEMDIARVSDGAVVATVYPLPDDDGAVVRDAEGHVELLPDDVRTRGLLWCHVRNVVLPAEACEERLVTSGVWSAVIALGISPDGQ